MVLVAVAALAVLVGVVYVVLGKGGQLARFEADFPPLDLPEGRPVGSRDLGGLLLPLSLWGYHVRAVDGLLLRLTATLREREERIEDLEWRLARLDPSYVPQGTGPGPDAYLPGDAPIEESAEPAEWMPDDAPQGPTETSDADTWVSEEDGDTADTAPEGTDTNPVSTDTPPDPAEYAPRDDDVTIGGGKRDEQD
ncbi:hypothetical protein DSY14_24455 [Nocardiopsis sp. MG754419]|nr:hypothetical protein [Nocardiopsis sp. MG754419]